MSYTALFTVAPPAVEPVSIAQALSHLRVDYTDDDTLIGTYISAARDWVEQYLNRALITQTLMLVQSHTRPVNSWPWVPLTAPLFVFPQWFPGSLLSTGLIELPRAPAQSVQSVFVGAWGQSDAALVPGTDYDFDGTMQPGRVRMHPSAMAFPQDHASITFTAGYGADAIAVPPSIILAVLWMTAFLYENRGDAGGEMPRAAQALLSPYRLVTFG